MKIDLTTALRLPRYGLLMLAVFATVGAQPNPYAELERGIEREHDRARTDPQAYAEEARRLLARFDGDLLHLPNGNLLRTQEGVAAVEEAVRFLRVQPALGPLVPSEGMAAGSRDHVRDVGPRNGVTHEGSDGSHVWDRVSRYGTWGGTIAENIAYGPDTALMVVLGLIVDDGVPDRGHRDNIFEPEFERIGVACGPHLKYRTMCVVSYATSYEEAEGG